MLEFILRVFPGAASVGFTAALVSIVFAAGLVSVVFAAGFEAED